MKITAADVNKLRKQTGAGMMDCKKALVESNGDFEEAVDFLRKQGQKVAAKRSDRDASEGTVIAKTTENGKLGAIIMLNCETDFVAQNADFVKFAENILETAISKKPADLEALKALPYMDSGLTIAEKITEQTGVIGEKVQLSSYGTVEADKVVAYIHPGNRLASVVGLNKDGNYDELGRDIAMQVAAMAPVALDKDGVPQDVIDREIEVGKEQAIQEGKPAEMAEKIAMGRLNKFYQENTLMNQSFIKDNKKSIKQYLGDAEKGLSVTAFKRFSLS
ncbi:elongation factor Ts [Cryomorpha ignava]|uniref:Elongation factor Ts n=1 Tax=Cryomorpha ignava TaxID=101383 RepID=A0A7K3WJW3_9FLAO|nr:translation elongation factor Ts [Cryomorpha ignava]NEN21916.1 elongation factor Ts [Cryomorpha ignava]